MNEFQQKRRLRKTLYSKTSIVIIAIIALLTIHGSWGAFQKERQSRKNMNEVEKGLIMAKQREDELSSNIQRLNTTQGLESEIRDKYSVKKADEEIVLVIEDNKNSATAEHQKSFWKKILDWLSDLF